jgi:hypothetical protein
LASWNADGWWNPQPVGSELGVDAEALRHLAHARSVSFATDYGTPRIWLARQPREAQRFTRGDIFLDCTRAGSIL